MASLVEMHPSLSMLLPQITTDSALNCKPNAFRDKLNASTAKWIERTTLAIVNSTDRNTSPDLQADLQQYLAPEGLLRISCLAEPLPLLAYFPFFCSPVVRDKFTSLAVSSIVSNPDALRGTCSTIVIQRGRTPEGPQPDGIQVFQWRFREGRWIISSVTAWRWKCSIGGAFPGDESAIIRLA